MNEVAAAPDRANVDQVAFWNADAGEQWAENQERIDANFADLTRTLIEFAAVPAGARVLDIGCGTGATVLALAEAAGPAGHVTGVDISRPMLAVARRRVAGLGNVALDLADAATHAFAAESFDRVVSRFGVMFFDEPAGAFGHIRRAIRPSGALAFVCWRAMSENPFFTVPWLAAKPHLPPQPPLDPTAPGPFAFADADRVRGILELAGFREAKFIRHDFEIGGGDLPTAVDMARRIGPAARAMREVDSEMRARAITAIEHAFRAYLRDGLVVLPASVWLVSARV
jgi:SAM-dependent methyltransferase